MKKLKYVRDSYHPDYGYPSDFRINAVIVYHQSGIEEAVKKFRVSRSSIKSWAKHYDISEAQFEKTQTNQTNQEGETP